jgi:hypothetical protein
MTETERRGILMDVLGRLEKLRTDPGGDYIPWEKVMSALIRMSQEEIK